MNGPNRPLAQSYWVVPGRFLAGEYPAHDFGPRLSRSLDAFLEFGIDTFIDLTDPDELPPYLPMLAEHARYYDIDIRYTRISIKDHNVPAHKHMRAILDAIDGALDSGRKVYLHCWGGIGRTGTVVGCHLVRRGLSGEQALAQLASWWQDVPKSRIWPVTPETKRQVEYVLNWDESPLPPGAPFRDDQG
jgi:predicted protein tyrosine phosphatase